MTEATLDTLMASDDDAVRQRAQMVRDTLEEGPTLAARRHGVTRQTAARWTARYQAGGVVVLSRAAENRRSSDELQFSVLTAPLWMTDAKWSSRTIAQAVGVSQSFVTRAWEPTRRPSSLSHVLAVALAEREPELVGLLVDHDRVVLVLRLSKTAVTLERPRVRRPDAAARRSAHAVLSSDMYRSRIHPEPGKSNMFWEELTAVSESEPGLLVVTSRSGLVPLSPVEKIRCETSEDWCSLWPQVAQAAVHCPGQFSAVEQKLRAWSHTPDEPFVWLEDTQAYAPEFGKTSRVGTRRRGTRRAVADDIIQLIRQGLADGRVARGDRITERFLARELRTTEGQIRAAVHLLESDGLLIVTTKSAAVVPIPTANDVIETYAARQAIGALVIRAAVRWSSEGRELVMRSLYEVERNALTNDFHGTSLADIHFQNTLADASGLVRLASMLEFLAEHLRMFVAVIGLEYAYPCDATARDDQRIVEAIDSGDAEAAVILWRQKMSDALTYMLDQLASSHVSREPRIRASRGE